MRVTKEQEATSLHPDAVLSRSEAVCPRFNALPMFSVLSCCLWLLSSSHKGGTQSMHYLSLNRLENFHLFFFFKYYYFTILLLFTNLLMLAVSFSPCTFLLLCPIYFYYPPLPFCTPKAVICGFCHTLAAGSFFCPPKREGRTRPRQR